MKKHEFNKITDSMEVIKKRLKEKSKPVTDIEEQNIQRVLESIQSLTYGKLIEGVPIEILEASLFHYWQCIFFEFLDFDVAEVELDESMQVVLNKFYEIACTYTDEDQTLEMSKMSHLIDVLKKEIIRLDKDVRSTDEISEIVAEVNTDIANLIETFFANEINPEHIKNSLIYFWLRSSTIRNNVDENIFQRLERNWPESITLFESYMVDYLREHN